MEAVIVLGIAGAGGLLWLLAKGAEAASAAAASRQQQARIRAEAAARAAALESRRRSELRRVNGLARNMQIALAHVGRAPDFRRAASWAALAKEVPLGFRQRQFRRFRAVLVQHYHSRLAAGANPETLSQSLTALVQALGVAPFEADYIRTEAERRLTPRTAPVRRPYAQRLAQLQAEHEQRMAALRGINLNDETREQLLEAEESRFREALQQEAQADDSHSRP
jgi:hypothetical protein